MKTLIAFYTAGVRSNRAYVPAEWLNIMVIRPGRSFLEATKYKTIVADGQVEVGGVIVDSAHVGPTKSLGSLRAHVLFADGELGPEAIHEGRGIYRNPITGQIIRHKHAELVFVPYSGSEVRRLLAKRHANREAGESDPPTPYDLDRARRVLARGDAIDVDYPLGKDMVNLRDIYFGSRAVRANLKLPPLWVATHEPPTPRQVWLDDQLMAMVHNEQVLDIELSPFASGEVLAIAEDENSGDIGILIGDPDGEGGEINLMLPHGAEVLVRPGEQLNYARRIVRLLPRRHWVSANQIRGELPSLARYVESACIDDATRVEPGLGTLYRIDMLERIPVGSEVLVENLSIETGHGLVQVIEADPADLYGYEGLVAYNLFHHRWCRADRPGSLHEALSTVADRRVA